MEIEDEDDFYAPEEPIVAPKTETDTKPEAGGGGPTNASGEDEELEEGEEEDEGGEIMEEDDDDSVGFSIYGMNEFAPYTMVFWHGCLFEGCTLM